MPFGCCRFDRTVCRIPDFDLSLAAEIQGPLEALAFLRSHEIPVRAPGPAMKPVGFLSSADIFFIAFTVEDFHNRSVKIDPAFADFDDIG